jgi:hypothetical protein
MYWVLLGAAKAVDVIRAIAKAATVASPAILAEGERCPIFESKVYHIRLRCALGVPLVLYGALDPRH